RHRLARRREMTDPPRVSVSAGAAAAPRTPTPDVGFSGTAVGILAAISFCHFLNDLMQSVLPAVYPLLKERYLLDFGQIGLITFANQATASLLQPVIGAFTDVRPQPFSLAIGMGCTL